MSALEHFLQQLGARLEAGAREYGDKSLVRSVAAIVGELDQELLDLPGWCFILWAQAWRKAHGIDEQLFLRQQFVHRLRRRIELNDRGRDRDAFAGAAAALAQLEVLCMDFFDFRQRVLERLQPIARQIEVAQAMDPYRGLRHHNDQYRGRHGGERNPRSDD